MQTAANALSAGSDKFQRCMAISWILVRLSVQFAGIQKRLGTSIDTRRI
jgi:hypothetical protein